MDNINLRHAFDDYVNTDMTFSDFKDTCPLGWKDKYGFLTIDTDCLLHKGRYRRGFDQFFTFCRECSSTGNQQVMSSIPPDSSWVLFPQTIIMPLLMLKAKLVQYSEAGSEVDHKDSIDDDYDDSDNAEDDDDSLDVPTHCHNEFPLTSDVNKALRILTLCLLKIPANLLIDSDICLTFINTGISRPRKRRFRSLKNLRTDALDVSPTCNITDIQAVIPFLPHPLKHIWCNVLDGRSNAPFQFWQCSCMWRALNIVLDEAPQEAAMAELTGSVVLNRWCGRYGRQTVVVIVSKELRKKYILGYGSATKVKENIENISVCSYLGERLERLDPLQHSRAQLLSLEPSSLEWARGASLEIGRRSHPCLDSTGGMVRTAAPGAQGIMVRSGPNSGVRSKQQCPERGGGSAMSLETGILAERSVPHDYREVVAWQWLQRSPTTKSNRVRFPMESRWSFRLRDSCRMIPLVNRFSLGYAFSPPLHSDVATCPPRLTLIAPITSPGSRNQRSRCWRRWHQQIPRTSVVQHEELSVVSTAPALTTLNRNNNTNAETTLTRKISVMAHLKVATFRKLKPDTELVADDETMPKQDF
ncbi:hypothetical protein PR048_013638 [Dryococelus australis]|uniref:Uncharacterized protein n=1 Tax=Dryococelus australis TaxID=614101 RepID=A0ABQ9HU98_9NEOP|nr:hypothetical protein PR048_013638 [Dryococelus australis]